MVKLKRFGEKVNARVEKVRKSYYLIYREMVRITQRSVGSRQIGRLAAKIRLSFFVVGCKAEKDKKNEG